MLAKSSLMLVLINDVNFIGELSLKMPLWCHHAAFYHQQTSVNEDTFSYAHCSGDFSSLSVCRIPKCKTHIK